MDKLAGIQNWLGQWMRNPRIGLAVGLSISLLAGASMPLPQLALLGPLVSAYAVGAMGARASTAVGFASFLAFGSPTSVSLVAAALIALFVGWCAPMWVNGSKSSESEPQTDPEFNGASAVVVNCEGFSTLDAVYGEGSSDHVFKLLHRALKVETRDTDLIVHIEGQELILVLDDANPEVAARVMQRVETRFEKWLLDAGYECDLSIGLENIHENEAEFEALMRSARQAQNKPYLD